VGFEIKNEEPSKLRNLGGHADVAPAGEVPGVGEVAALLGFDRLDPAVLTVQKDAGAVRLIDQGQAAAVGTQTGVLLNEIGLLQSEVTRNGGDLFFGHLHVARPTAAVGAALAEVLGGLLQEIKIKIKMKMKVEAGT